MSNNTSAQKKEFYLPKLRHLVQLIFLAVMGKWIYYGIFRCPFIVPFVNCERCPVVTCWGRITAYFFGFWLFIPLLAIFLGRAFCGWLCPSGFVNQMLGKVAITKLKIRNKKMRWAQLGMVVTILIGLGVYFIYDNPRVMIPIRTSDEYFNSFVRLSS